VLVANRRSLTERPAQLLPIVHELLERLDAHLKAEDFYSGVCVQNPGCVCLWLLGWLLRRLLCCLVRCCLFVLLSGECVVVV
jgi:hypothetical protein